MSVRPIRNLRWWIGGMLFLSTIINYLDRQTLSLLAPFLKLDYHWTNTDYANILIGFRVGYSLGQTVLGRMIDRIGTRRGLDRTQPGDDAVERLVPAHREQGAALVLAHQRLGQSVARVEQFGGGEALAAQAAFVGGEIARSNHQAAMLRHQAHAALQSAVRAVRLAFVVDGHGHIFRYARLPVWRPMSFASAS